MTQEKVGFVGLGLMGQGMAKNIVEKGYPLTVVAHRKRAAVDDLVSRGAVEAASLEELARGCSVIFLCLTGSPEVFARNIDEALHSTIDSVNHEVRANPAISPSQKSREIVNQLHELGIFELKDSAQVAATRLGISVHSIYRYLREIKANQA